MSLTPVPHLNPMSVYNTSLSVSVPQSGTTLSYSFWFQTVDPNGLLLFSYGTNTGDFVALELIQGVLRLIYRIRGDTDLLTSNSNNKLNDGQWHSVSVTRLVNRKFHLRVDDYGYTAALVC